MIKVKNLALFIFLKIFYLNVLADDLGSKWIKDVFENDKPSPTIIVAHGCDGAQNLHYYFWAKQIRDWGYNAVLIDLFTARGFNNLCHNWSAISAKERISSISEVVDKIKSSKFHNGKIGLIGYSQGGTLALNIANETQETGIDAVVGYYPGCPDSEKSYYERFLNPKIPMAIMIGENDDWTPLAPCLETNKNSKYEMHIYPNSSHGFDMNERQRTYLNHRLWYNHEADVDSRKQTNEFFKKYLH